MASHLNPPWALDDSKAPHGAHTHKVQTAKASQSTAKGVIFSNYETAPVDGNLSGKRMPPPEKMDCPFAQDNGGEPGRVSDQRRITKATRGDVGDRYASGSDKVGSVPLSSDVYSANLRDSRARMVSARNAAQKGAGGFTDAPESAA